MVLIAALSACTGEAPPEPPPPAITLTTPPQPAHGRPAVDLTTAGSARSIVRPLVDIIRGTGRLTGAVPQGSRPAATGEGDFSLAFVQTDLREVIRAVLGDMLRENYVIDPRVQGSVTLETSTPVGREALLPILETVVRSNGFTLTQSGNVIAVVPATEAQRAASLAGGDDARSGFSYQVFPLRYIGATEMQSILRGMMASDVALQPVPGREVLIAGGGSRDLATIADLVRVFDVDTLSGMSFAILSPRNAEANVLMRELQALMGADRSTVAAPARFLLVERLNQVIAIARRPEILEEIAEWTERLDQAAESVDERVFVYHVQNGRAADLSATLSALYGTREDANPGTTRPAAYAFASAAGDTPQIIPPGTTPLPGVPGVYQGTAADGRPTLNVVEPADRTVPQNQPSPTSDLASSAAPVDATTTGIGLGRAAPRVIADEKTNTLLVLTTPKAWKGVLATLQQLDAPPLQVLIEAAIAEVTLTNDLRYGVQTFLSSSDGKSFGVLSNSGGTGISPTLPGFAAVISTGADFRVVLSALESVTKVNVVSAPKLMVLNNQTASLQVGDQVPIATQQAISTTTPGAPIVNTIQFRDTGVILRVTPRVNDGGLVLMEITQEVSEVARTTTSGIDSPTIQQRKITSSVSVQSGETVALGGLIRDRVSRGDGGIPLLKDVPWIGNLFKTTTDNDARTELLVLITPRVARGPADLRGVTDALRRQMRSLPWALE